MKTPISFIISLLLLVPNIHFGQVPDLGDATSFAVFTSDGAFGNDGNTVITGDIGTNVGAFTGFPPGIVIGQIHVADLVSSQAAPDVDMAYSYLAGLTCGTVLGTTMGGGQILTPDIYCLGAASVINGTLVLDGQGDPGAIFIFQIDGALSTGVLANVVLINSASICNVFWQVNGAFTLGDGSIFRGNLINNGAIHLLEASSVFGRVLSRAGAIDLHNNVVSIGLPATAPVIIPDGPLQFCFGGSVNLSGNIDGTWNTGSTSGSINVTSGGDYYVINTTLCGSDTSNHIIVTVIENTPPSITCPADLTLECDQSTAPAFTGIATASDICDPSPTITSVDVQINGQCPQSFIISRIWTATDATGNTNTCEQIIMVSDITAPAITCPPNITIQCNTDTSPLNTGNATATDNCDTAPLITYIDEVSPSQTCLQAFTIFRSWRATDACLNISFCSQLITVIDNTPPVINCPANVTLVCGDNTLPASTGTASGLDNCDPIPITDFTDVLIPAAGCPSIIRTWTLTDDCGNASSCTQTITVTNGTTISITCPGAVSVQCTSLVPAADITTVITSGTCTGIISVTFTGDVVSNQTCANRYTITRTYTASDACGNVATCTQAITVFDNTAPSINCPLNITVQCASQVPAAVPSAIVTGDNCGPTSTVSFIGDVITPGACANRYLITRTYRSTDACGNTTECNQQISIFDNTPPSITCPSNITVQCATQLPVANPTGIVTADNCGGAATVAFVNDVVSNFICANQFVVTRTYRAIDNCGNTSLCTQLITVFDNSALSIACPANVTVQCAALVPAINLNLSVITSACGGTTTVTLLSDVISNQTCTNRYTLTRTYLATDACAHTSTCSQTITVFDNTPPAIILPNGWVNGGTFDVQCFGQDPQWDLPVFDASSVNATDNCTGLVNVNYRQDVIDQGTCTEDGYINRYRLTWTATDACGNSSSAYVFMELIDTIAPVIHGVPADITVNCDLIPDPPALIFATDECLCACVLLVNETLPTSGCLDGQVILRTWTAKDRCGNMTIATQRITLIDNALPIMQFLQPEMSGMGEDTLIEYTCSTGGLPAFLDGLSAASVVTSSACGSAASMTFDHQILEARNCEFSGYIEQHVFHWEATDACGHVEEFTFIASLIDDVAPVLIGVPSIACINDPALKEIEAVDDCGDGHVRFWDVTVANPCGDGTALRRTYEAYDNCGNMSRDTVILIPNDHVNPVIEFVTPMLKDLVEGEVLVMNCTMHDQLLTPFGTHDVSMTEGSAVSPGDFCSSGTTISYAEHLIESGDCSADGYVALIEMVWTATDVCGNLSTLSVVASVEDNSSPVFVDFNSNVSIGCRDSLPAIIATDNCGEVFITTIDDYIYDDCGVKYDLHRVVTATDACGNSATRIQTIHVGGDGPVIKGVEKEICNDLTIPMVTAFDECSGLFVDVTMTQDTLENECEGFTIRRMWSAVNACGDSTEITQMVVVGDTIPPVILIPSYSVVQLFIDGLHNVVNFSEADLFLKLNGLNANSLSVSDNCQDIDLVFTLTVTPFDCELSGFSERRIYTWTATDVCGNSSSKFIIIDVIDDVPPVITGVPNDTMIVCEPLPVVPVLNGSDLSMPVGVVFTESTSPGDGAGIFIVTRTWTFTDACGNKTVRVQKITWIPDSFLVCNINIPEVVECNSHGVIINADLTGGFGPYTYLWEVVGSKCFIQGGQGTPGIEIYMGWSDVKVILIVTDAFGCQSMCMTVLHCLEPGVLPVSSESDFVEPSVQNTLLQNNHVISMNAEKEVFLKDLLVWPNPADGFIQLSFSSSREDEVVIQFTDFLGRVMMTDKMAVVKGSNTRGISTEQLPGGSYLLEVKSMTEVYSKVVVILPKD